MNVCGPFDKLSNCNRNQRVVESITNIGVTGADWDMKEEMFTFFVEEEM
jgi:hypothetical protein